jgi:hypothetical protein
MGEKQLPKGRGRQHSHSHREIVWGQEDDLNCVCYTQIQLIFFKPEHDRRLTQNLRQ